MVHVFLLQDIVPYFLYSATLNGPYTKEIPASAGTWYAIARVDGNEIYDSLESEPIQFVIKPKTLQDVSFNENLQLFDNQMQLQEGIDYTYTIEDRHDYYRYVITLKGNYHGTIIKDVKKKNRRKYDGTGTRKNRNRRTEYSR